MTRRYTLRLVGAVLAVFLTACAHSPSYDPQDPLENANRMVFAFNAAADTYLIRPTTVGYTKVVPDFARSGLRNVLSNLFYPTVIVNDLLQCKWRQAGLDLGRFLTNSTAGVAGLFDVATAAGMPVHDEDFGQTLGYWGVGEGWFLMIPVLGPSSNRGIVGRTFDAFTNPTITMPADTRAVIGALDALDTRSSLLGTDQLVNQQFDPYAFLRTVYLDRRHNLIHDGSPPPEVMDFDFGD